MRSTITAYRGSSSSRAPPNCASSARTPMSRPLAFTTSKNGWGKVFSRPINRPTTLDIPTHHLPPIRPVVGPSGPDVEGDSDGLVVHQAGHLHGLGGIGIAFPGRDDLLLHRPEG